MPFANLVRWSGLAAMVGGALWVFVCVLFALRPSGPELQPPYRSPEGLGIAGVLSLLLIVAGMVSFHPRSKGAYGGLGTAGFVLALVGAAPSIVSFGSWPLIFIGSYALMLGSLLVGVAAFGAKTIPRWGAVVLWVGSAAFFMFNTETVRGVVRGAIRGVVGGCRLPSLARHGIRATLAREVNFSEPPQREARRTTRSWALSAGGL